MKRESNTRNTLIKAIMLFYVYCLENIKQTQELDLELTSPPVDLG